MVGESLLDQQQQEPSSSKDSSLPTSLIRKLYIGYFLARWDARFSLYPLSLYCRSLSLVGGFFVCVNLEDFSSFIFSIFWDCFLRLKSCCSSVKVVVFLQAIFCPWSQKMTKLCFYYISNFLLLLLLLLSFHEDSITCSSDLFRGHFARRLDDRLDN